MISRLRLPSLVRSRHRCLEWARSSSVRTAARSRGRVPPSIDGRPRFQGRLADVTFNCTARSMETFSWREWALATVSLYMARHRLEQFFAPHLNEPRGHALSKSRQPNCGVRRWKSTKRKRDGGTHDHGPRLEADSGLALRIRARRHNSLSINMENRTRSPNHCSPGTSRVHGGGLSTQRPSTSTTFRHRISTRSSRSSTTGCRQRSSRRSRSLTEAWWSNVPPAKFRPAATTSRRICSRSI